MSSCAMALFPGLGGGRVSRNNGVSSFSVFPHACTRVFDVKVLRERRKQRLPAHKLSPKLILRNGY
jgi:hypothetical protein